MTDGDLSRCFFVLACARSGSTSLARILDTAANARCAVEPVPDLNVETRLLMEGRLTEPRRCLEEKVLPRVRSQLGQVEVYGEKHVTYGPFVEDLWTMTGGRFVLLKRDGRDVVRSLMDWHQRMFGNVYRECRETGDLSGVAISAAANLPVHRDTSDFARPRPVRGDPLHETWETLSREEMCAWYWSRVNALYCDQLARIPVDAWFELDYSTIDAERIAELAAFLGLRGIDRAEVEQMLARRINSLADRIGEPDRHPAWTEWDSGRRDRFEALAGATMRELGYFRNEPTRWRPRGFGRFWLEHEGGLPWYEWMYGTRRAMHEALVAWVGAPERSASIASIADFGCGVGVGYCDAFEGRRYVGFDLAPQNVEWCREHRSNPRHEYHCVDFVAEPLRERYDLVFSSGTIDNGWDADAYLRAMVRASRGWVQLTCYRGWFPELSEHRYAYNPDHACFYNDLSPARIRRTLVALGCTEITVEPVPTGNHAIPFETWVAARVPR